MRLLYWHGWLKNSVPSFTGNFQGLKFVYHTQTDGCAQAYITPSYDHAQQTLIRKLLGPKTTYVDVGANVGTEVLLALQAGSKVYAFEPTQDSFELLQANVNLNSFAKMAQLFQTALADKAGKLTFYAFDDGLALKNSAIQSDASQRKITVPATTLDLFIEKEKPAQVTLLKIDVEGAELLVLKGGQKALKKGLFQAIYWESNQMGDPEQRANTREFLTKFGYQHYAFDPSDSKLVPYTNQEDCLSIHSKYVSVVTQRLAT
jgi:FkbM family methyltransferase